MRVLSLVFLDHHKETTKVYKIPNSNLIITASVFYTDEMIEDSSITLALAVANKSFESALIAPQVIQTDVALSNLTGIVRVKTFIIVNKKRFAVGLQCNCNQREKKD